MIRTGSTAWGWRTAKASLMGCAMVATTWGAPRTARACGGGLVSIAQSTVAADAQLIFISVRGNGTTDIVTEIGVPESTAAYGVLLPLPAQPTLDPEPVPADELMTLASATAPTIRQADVGGGGCGCPLASGSKAGGDVLAPPITIGAPVNIGPVTAVVLDAAAPEPVNAWLAANGFVIPTASAPLVAAYAGPGRTFVAIKRSATATAGAPTSVGVHLTVPGDVRDLPLRFARLGAAVRVSFTVLIAAPGESGPSAPFDAITINDLSAADLGGPGYSEAVFRAIDARDGRAFVAEHSGAISGLRTDVGPALSKLIDPTATLTRLSAVFGADRLTTDVSFQTPLGRPIPRARTLVLAPTQGRGPIVASKGRAAGVGMMLGLSTVVGLCAWVLGRRRRR